MALHAFGLDVFAAQDILCISIMLKLQGLPVFFDVTGLALGTESCLVLIVLFVTGNASGRCTFKARVRVAILASHIHMLTQQRKVRLAVIEMHFLPIIHGMAVGTLGSKLAFVRVVFLVTGITGRRGIAVFFVRQVAITTRYLRFGVSALQFEICLVMVEDLLVKR